MLERRLHLTLRTQFDALKADLLQRLERITRHLSAPDRDALAAEMTRRRVRHEYRQLLTP